MVSPNTALTLHVSRLLNGEPIVIADVGAAYGLPPHLQILAPLARLCLFEPNAMRAQELRASQGERLHVFPVALSSNGGTRTLYVTNVPTGSSLLKPGSDAVDLTDPNYFFPVREERVETERLMDVLAQGGIPRLDFIKADVQGAELEVLQGMGDSYCEKLLGAELEVGFPGAYVNQPGFAEIDLWLKQRGFELFDLRPARLHRYMHGAFSYVPETVFGVRPESGGLSKRIWEADLVYFRRPEALLKAGDTAALRRLLALYCAYGFFVDAVHLSGRVIEQKLLSQDAGEELQRMIVKWHRRAQYCVLDSPAWRRLIGPLGRVTAAARRLLCGRRAARWIE
jgi:FkbM family methyltransferase